MAGWHSLSGYLTQRPNGPLGRLQSRRRRWFVFDELRCELLAYSNEAEYLARKDPVDVIQIRGAGILLSEDQPNQFMIQSRRNEYVLVADTHEAMMIWLLALQAKRDMCNNHLASVIHAGRKRRYSVKTLFDTRKSSLPSGKELATMIRRASHAEEDTDYFLRNQSINVNSHTNVYRSGSDGPWSLPILENVSTWRPSSDSSDVYDGRSSTSEPITCRTLSLIDDGNEKRKLSDTTCGSPTRRQKELECELIGAKCELAKSVNREASLKQNLQEAYQRICALEDRLQGGNSAPCGGNCGQKLQEKARILQNQNRFLNEEVLKVSRLWQQDHLRLVHAQQRMIDQEDLIDQLSRDYILLMQASLSNTEADCQSTTPRILGGARHKNRILKMLEECRRVNPYLPSLEGIRKFSCHVDTFGFRNCPEGEAATLHYLCSQLSQHFETQLLDHEPQNSRWRQIIGTGNSIPVTKELKTLVRAGIPADIRNHVWVEFVHGRVADVIKAKGEHYYNHLISLVPDSQMVCQSRRQIALDLLRTMPDNIHFSDVNADGVQKMQEVLQAFCLHNPTIGYCQGMNFIVAVALLFMEPADTFWLLVALSERYFLPHYFDQSLVGAQADQHVLRELVQEKLPKLSEHFESYDIELCTVTLNWFLALFFDCVPFQTLLRIWDCFLLEGPKVLFRFSLALLKINETLILEKNDPVSIMRQIKMAAKYANDIDALVKVAFEDLEPFVHRADIAVKQSCYHKILKENHRKLAAQRKVTETKEKMLHDLNEGDKISIECATLYDRDKLWLCQGNREFGQVFQVNGGDNIMYNLNIEFNSRIMCVHVVNEKIMLVGTLAHFVYAFNVFSRDQLWKSEINDAMLAFGSHRINGQFRAYAALADGTVAIFENVCSASCSNLLTSYVKISSSPISCFLLINEHLWCSAANKVIVLNTQTLDVADQFVVSSNVMDVVSHIVDGVHGVWLAVRGSSVIQVWDRQSLVCTLMFDIGNQRYPRRTYDEDAFNPSRVTAILPFKNRLWVGTGDGNLLVFDISRRSTRISISEGDSGSGVNKINLDVRQVTNNPQQKTVRDRSDSGYQTVGVEVNKSQDWHREEISGNVEENLDVPTCSSSPIVDKEVENGIHSETCKKYPRLRMLKNKSSPRRSESNSFSGRNAMLDSSHNRHKPTKVRRCSSVTSIHSSYQKLASYLEKSTALQWRNRQHYGSFDDVSHLLSGSRESLISSPFCDSFEYDDVFVAYTDDENCFCDRFTDSFSEKWFRSSFDVERLELQNGCRVRRNEVNEVTTPRNLCISMPIHVSIDGPETSSTKVGQKSFHWSSLEDLSTPSHIEYDSVQDSYNRMDYLKLGLDIPLSTAKSSDSGSYVSYASSDAPYVLELSLKDKIKVGHNPIKILIPVKSSDGEASVISFTGACGDEDAVRKWTLNDDKSWTSCPILEVCPYTNEIKPYYSSSPRHSSRSSANDDAESLDKKSTNKRKISSNKNLHLVNDVFTKDEIKQE